MTVVRRVGGWMASETRAAFRVLCGVWQARQPTNQEPFVFDVDSLEWLGRS